MAESLLRHDVTAPPSAAVHAAVLEPAGFEPAGPGLGTDPHGLDKIGRALADPIRRSILISLLGGSRRPSELADEIGTSRSNLSNHLSCLRGCGLISAARTGRHLHYDLVSTHFAEALQMLVDIAVTLPSCDRPDADRSTA